MKIISKAPVRILDIGGWTDTWFCPDGAVFNICIDLYSYSRIEHNQLNKTRVFAENFEKFFEYSDINNLNYDGTLDLLKAALKKFSIDSAIDIYVKADAPPGSGTGTSASVAVSLVAALSFYQQKRYTNYEIAQIAHELETDELHLESGVQDQFAASFGGVNFMEINYPHAKITNIKFSSSQVNLLQNQLILVYLGMRSSSEMHKKVIKNYLNKNKQTLKSFDIMKNCAYKMKEAINSDIYEIGSIMNENWQAQKELHPLMSNALIEKAERIAGNHDSLGFKCNGAGGGGSAIIMADIGKKDGLREDLIASGFIILPFKFCFEGVQTYPLQ